MLYFTIVIIDVNNAKKDKDMKKYINVAILVFPDSFVSGVVGIDDIFKISNNFCKQEKDSFFKVTFVSLENNSLNNTHLSLKSKNINENDSYDIIIIPPLTSTSGLLVKQENITSWLIKMYHKGSLLTSVCAGSFLLAQTGLLDFKKATTHWLYENLFKENYTNINLQCEMIIIDEGDIITAGGLSAYMDLALYLVEKFQSREASNFCANLLLVERGRDSQRSYKNLTTTLLIEDESIKKLLKWMKNNLHKTLTTKVLSSKINLQERTFLRLFKKTVQTTPNQYLQNLRIEEAKNLLINSHKSFDHITNDVGFDNESSFRRLFKRETSLNPGEYRKKFQY